MLPRSCLRSLADPLLTQGVVEVEHYTPEVADMVDSRGRRDNLGRLPVEDNMVYGDKQLVWLRGVEDSQEGVDNRREHRDTAREARWLAVEWH